MAEPARASATAIPVASGRSTTSEPNPLLRNGALTVAEAGDDFASLFDDEGEADGGAPRPDGEEEPEGEEGGEENAEVEGDEVDPELETDEELEEGEEEPALEAEPGPVDPSLMVPVTIDGEVKEVPLAELQRSYLQQADYTRKTTALAEERRAFDERSGAWSQETQALDAQLDQLMPVLIEQFRSTQKTAAELERLKAEDPGSWSAYMHERRQQIETLRNAKQVREQRTAALETERRRALEASVPTEMQSLMAKNPRFRKGDGSFNEAHYEAVGKFLLSQGIKAEEWAELYDHRYLHLAELAMSAVAATRSVKRAAPSLAKLARPVRPGTPQKRVAPREADAQRLRAKEARLKRTGSVRDAGDLFAYYF